MLHPLILTIVVLICLGLILAYAMPPIASGLVMWAIRALIVAVAVAAILKIWGISF